MVNGRDCKVWWFSKNEFRKNIGCFVLAPTFRLGGQGYEIRGSHKILVEMQGRDISLEGEG